MPRGKRVMKKILRITQYYTVHISCSNIKSLLFKSNISAIFLLLYSMINSDK